MPQNKVFNILVIDDETMTLKMTKQGLERSGFSVAIFSRPEKSLDYFKEAHQELDLVITDKNMPTLTGLQLIKKFREIKTDIPIFVLTGFSDHEEDEKLIEAGATRILMKPLSIRDIVKEIKEILGDD